VWAHRDAVLLGRGIRHSAGDADGQTGEKGGRWAAAPARRPRVQGGLWGAEDEGEEEELRLRLTRLDKVLCSLL